MECENVWSRMEDWLRKRRLGYGLWVLEIWVECWAEHL
jgi:hypothetical protein